MRRLRLSAGLAVAIIVAAVVLAVALNQGPGRMRRAPRAPQTLQAPDFGADVGQIFQLQVFSPRQVDRLLAAAPVDGLGLARAAPQWEVTEPAPPVDGRHRYDWRYDDFLARELASHHLRWVAVLAYAPRWASEAPDTIHGAPRSVADYAAYAQAIARRYRGQIAAYEIWNEENSRAFWRPAPDPEAYARLYLAARQAIKTADPATPVLVGGLADGNHSFLDRLLGEPGLRGHVDGLAIHPYGAEPVAVLDRVRLYRDQVDSLGWSGLPLYVTEFGWSTNPPGNLTYAPPQQQAGYIAFTAAALVRSGCGVRMAIFYAWFTPELNRLDVNDWYGVSGLSGPSPAADRDLRAAARAMTRAGTGEAAGCLAASP